MGQTVLVTGANRGIGLAFVTLFLERADKVFAACRKASSELRETGAEVIENMDITSDDSVRQLVSSLNGAKINLVVNNAGILINSGRVGSLDYDAVAQQFQVNAVGAVRVTEALVDHLQGVDGGPAKVALITSRMGSIADNTSGGSYGYRMSKAALNAAGVSLAHDLKERDIAVAILHPGFVQTDMVNFAGDISAATAAERLACRIDELDLSNTGTFWHSNGETLPW